MLNLFKTFAAWLLGVINSIFKQTIGMEAFLNVFIIVVMAVMVILLIGWIVANAKYKALVKNLKRDNIQVVKQTKKGKAKLIIRTKTALKKAAKKVKAKKQKKQKRNKKYQNVVLIDEE